MKAFIKILVHSILFAGCYTPQEEISYGSNNGKHISINNTRIYFEEYGQGTPLLLLSGGGINRSIKDFGECIPGLAKRYRIIAPDTPGQGRSEETDTLSYAILTELMSRLLDSLHVDSAYVMGWSDGGIVSLMLADKRPDKIKKIIAVGANNGMRGFALPDGFLLDSVKMPSLQYFATANKKDIEWFNSLTPKNDWKKTVNNINNMVYQKEYFPLTVYSSINIPVMLVLGDRDDITIAHGLEMHSKIKNSQYCVLPNTTHDVFAERPELITRIALDFLN
ncbi:MAG: alpha/beta hydrolase [Chitinophagaceae bacterium]|nr:MAG: alpha/beta hydrolase [Chitinophagaceae bacterium]